MDKNKLQLPHETGLATQTTVNQYGEKNIHIDEVANLHQNVIMVPMFQRPSAGGRPTQQALRTDYYHLFVMGGETFETDHFIVPPDRALMKYWTNDELRDKYGSLSVEAIEELKMFPALFMPEPDTYYAKAGEDQAAYFGFVTDIRVQDNGIKIRYNPMLAIPLQAVCNIGFELGMKDMTRALTELNKTHWALKRINLVEELKDAKLFFPGF